MKVRTKHPIVWTVLYYAELQHENIHVCLHFLKNVAPPVRMNEFPPLFRKGGARHLFATQAWKREDVMGYLITQTSSNIRCPYPDKREGANSKKKTTEAKDTVVYLLS